jgi:hypothetical protein
MYSRIFSGIRWHPLDKKKFTRHELILERCEDVLQDPEDGKVVISFSCESVFTGSSVAENISKCNALVPGSYFRSSFIYVYLVGPYGLAENVLGLTLNSSSPGGRRYNPPL